MRRLAWETVALAMWLALVLAIAAQVTGWMPESRPCTPEFLMLQAVEGLGA